MYVQTKSSVTVNKKVIRYYYLNVITTLGNHSFRTEEKFLLKFNSTLDIGILYKIIILHYKCSYKLWILATNVVCTYKICYTTADFGQDNYMLCNVLI